MDNRASLILCIQEHRQKITFLPDRTLPCRTAPKAENEEKQEVEGAIEEAEQEEKEEAEKKRGIKGTVRVVIEVIQRERRKAEVKKAYREIKYDGNQEEQW